MFPRPGASLGEILDHWASARPDSLVYRFLPQEGGEETRTFAELRGRAAGVARALAGGASAGGRVVLACSPGLPLIDGLWGCACGGVTAVPVPPPRLRRSGERFRAVLEDCRPALVLVDRENEAAVREAVALMGPSPAPALLSVEEAAADPVHGMAPGLFPPGGEALAVLQYTSGSTGRPRGVMLSHANLFANLEAIRVAFRLGVDTRSAFWLPPYHDMGLIGGVLSPAYVGGMATLMSPVAFAQEPLRWVHLVSRYRAGISGGPNFAYGLCADAAGGERAQADLAALDLACWRVAFCGAEPISASTLSAFAGAFAGAGFAAPAYYPCYGLAEATLLVSGGTGPGEPVAGTFRGDALEGGRAVPCAPDEARARTLTGCGAAMPGHDVVVVDPAAARAAPDGAVGEIWLRGPSVARGYWDRPEETERVFGARLKDGDGPFLRTGDLGFVHGGQLYVTGRLKDVLIIRGANHHPADIEQVVVAAHPALASAAGTVCLADGDAGQLVVVHELNRRFRRDPPVDEIAAAVRSAVARDLELAVAAVVLVAPLSLPKTTSGKLQRHRVRELLAGGGLKEVARWEAGAATPGAAPFTGVPTDAAAFERWLAAWISARQGIAVQEIDADESFAGYGLDSVAAVAVTGDLSKLLGRRLSATLAYDYPRIREAAAYLASLSAPPPVDPSRRADSADSADSVDPADSADSADSAGAGDGHGAGEGIAIVGMACRVPGAPDLHGLRRMLRAGEGALGPLPSSRRALMPLTERGAADVAEMRGGFLEGIDEMDAGFFGISPREAAEMDPQQRLLLETAYQAVEDAGIPLEALAESPTGVFVGISTNEYGPFLGDPGSVSPYSGTGNAGSIAANRLSYLWDLRGPSMALDTACSSSLVAVDHACHALARGDCTVALAGGVNLILTPHLSRIFAQARMLSPDGESRAFDAGANGYVRSEGCGVVVLRPVADAVRDGDRIYAVIRGSAVNQDGRTNGLTAPNGRAQQAVVRAALARAGVRPWRVGYVEAHGTGTPLGDPIELNALRAVLESPEERRERCYVGSIKGNLGHLEAAAGALGLIKAALALHGGEIFPHPRIRRLNPEIDLGGVLAIPAAPVPWPSGAAPRVAGVSSFGFGGTNAHVVLEEAPRAAAAAGEARPPESAGAHLLLLSARDAAALRELAVRYAARLTGDGPALGDLCHRAATRRSRFPHRLAVVAASAREMADALDRFARGGGGPDVLHGTVRERAGAAGTGPEPAIAGDDDAAGERTVLRALGERFVRGMAVRLPGPAGAPCAWSGELPRYPFQRQRYWRGEPPREGALDTGHPALRDHRVEGVPVVPATFYLEAVTRAARSRAGGRRVALRDVAFHRPLLVPAEGGAGPARIVFTPAGEGHASFQVFGGRDGGEPVLHASGTVVEE